MLWSALLALIGILIGGLLVLLVVWSTERSHTYRDVALMIVERKYMLYHRTLAAVDELLYMRDDHPDFGSAARTLTTAVVELELLAPPELAELAEHCAALVLRRPGNPLDAAHARARFAAVARQDLAVVDLRRMRSGRTTTGRHARHATTRSTDLAERGIIGPVSPGVR